MENTRRAFLLSLGVSLLTVWLYSAFRLSATASCLRRTGAR